MGIGLTEEEQERIDSFTALGFKLLGWGGYRAVFSSDDPDWVFKLALNKQGVEQNLKEAKLFEEGEKDIPLARCYLEFVHGEEVLFMEHVEVYRYLDPEHPHAKDMPPWTYRVQRLQVGWTRERRLVAYDFDFFSSWPKGAVIHIEKEHV